MVVDTVRKMEALIAGNAERLPAEILLDIAHAEAEAYASGIFIGRYTQQFEDIRNFYEHLVVLLTKAKEFFDVETKFILLNRLYQLPTSLEHPSLYEAKLISLYLLFLYTSKDKELYYAELASLEPRVAASADIKVIVEFEQLIELGNYQGAFDLIQTLSPSHQALLSRLDEQRRYQTCKMIEYNHPYITVTDLWKILEIKTPDDFNRTHSFIEELYQVN